jgi:KUP system potassium uptake protein
VSSLLTDPPDDNPSEKPAPQGKALALLSLTALGVVYGDIGTSPLYALKECFSGPHGLPPTRENVLGVLSLIFWSLNFIISFKYVAIMLRADNRGEGGILALLALLRPRALVRGGRWAMIMAGIFGAALLYGDGIITPAISVLGAVEGLSVATHALEPFVIWISIVIIVALFVVQRFGTEGVGRVFGPVTTLWFICIAALGVYGIWHQPTVLRALNPWYMVDFFMRDGIYAFLILAAVVLVVTGGEALYADMGHFGKRPIRIAWFAVVLPALVLNYFGQGAILLENPAARVNPFYMLVPGWALYPMVVVATSAAVVASQALISGAFSLTRQAIQLGYCPRVTIIHTSHKERGQIYIPEVNWALMFACVGLVLAFQTSSNLAATYGVAVTGTMTVTTLLFMAVARERWHWDWFRVLAIGGVIMLVDLAFFSANLVKIPDGGWFPLAVAALVFVIMSTWKRGRYFLTSALKESSLPLMDVIRDVEKRRVYRVPGTAVFMTSDPDGAPPVLLHHLKHNKVLHEKVILLSIQAEEIPQVREKDRVDFKELGAGFYQVIANYGFMESPDVPAVLQALALKGDAMDLGGLTVTVMETTFYLGRETLLPTGTARMAGWRKQLFIVMTRNAQSATAFFNLPPNRVVEMGAQIQL